MESIWIAQRIGPVLDVSDDGLESGHAFAIVQEQRDDRGQQQDGDEHAGERARRTLLGLVGTDYPVGHRFVAVFARISLPAHATVDRVTNEILVGTFTYLHAVIAVIPIRAHLGTRRPGESRLAVARAVDGATGSAVLTLAPETAVDAVRTGRAHRRAVGTRPSRIAVAQAGHVMTVAELAVARSQTSLAVRLGRTGVLAYRPDVPGPALELAGNVVARQVRIVRAPPLRAFLTATEPVLARLARRVALGPFPSAGTRALGVVLAARTVVKTVALVLALVAEQSTRAQRLAPYAIPAFLAFAFARNRVTRYCIFRITLAVVRTVSAVFSRRTRRFTLVAGKTRLACTGTVYGTARRVVVAVAFVFTVFPVVRLLARRVAPLSSPPVRTQTHAGFRRTLGAVVALTLVRAILAVRAFGTGLVARRSAIAGATHARPVVRQTLRVVVANAFPPTPLAECVQRTRSGTRRTVPTRCAFTRSRPRVT